MATPPSYDLSSRDRQRLKGSHPDLIQLCEWSFQRFPLVFSATPEFKLIITEGIRTRKMQQQYVAAGKSWTLNSRHLVGLAVDFAIVGFGTAHWEWPLFERLAKFVVLPAAEAIGINVVWGGSWKSRDGPHFELVGPKYTEWAAEFKVKEK